jgi:hypothetical protein
VPLPSARGLDAVGVGGASMAASAVFNLNIDG